MQTQTAPTEEQLQKVAQEAEAAVWQLGYVNPFFDHLEKIGYDVASFTQEEIDQVFAMGLQIEKDAAQASQRPASRGSRFAKAASAMGLPTSSQRGEPTETDFRQAALSNLLADAGLRSAVTKYAAFQVHANTVAAQPQR